MPIWRQQPKHLRHSISFSSSATSNDQLMMHHSAILLAEQLPYYAEQPFYPTISRHLLICAKSVSTVLQNVRNGTNQMRTPEAPPQNTDQLRQPNDLQTSQMRFLPLEYLGYQHPRKNRCQNKEDGKHCVTRRCTRWYRVIPCANCFICYTFYTKGLLQNQFDKYHLAKHGRQNFKTTNFISALNQTLYL